MMTKDIERVALAIVNDDKILKILETMLTATELWSAARAAILALAEPSDEMVEAALRAVHAYSIADGTIPADTPFDNIKDEDRAQACAFLRAVITAALRAAAGEAPAVPTVETANG